MKLLKTVEGDLCIVLLLFDSCFGFLGNVSLGAIMTFGISAIEGVKIGYLMMKSSSSSSRLLSIS